MPEIFDHTGAPVLHGRARVNGIRMHYVTAGQGEPLLLLHGLTEHFTVVAPDLRGFGDTDRPPLETYRAGARGLAHQQGAEAEQAHTADPHRGDERLADLLREFMLGR